MNLWQFLAQCLWWNFLLCNFIFSVLSMVVKMRNENQQKYWKSHTYLAVTENFRVLWPYLKTSRWSSYIWKSHCYLAIFENITLSNHGWKFRIIWSSLKMSLSSDYVQKLQGYMAMFENPKHIDLALFQFSQTSCHAWNCHGYLSENLTDIWPCLKIGQPSGHIQNMKIS